MNETTGHKDMVNSRAVTGMTASLITTDVLAGVICGIFAVFVMAWMQGGSFEIDPAVLIDRVTGWVGRIYPH